MAATTEHKQPNPPSLPVLRRVDDQAQHLINSEVSTFLKAAANQPFAWGNRVTVALSAGVATRVRHGLPRPPLGYIVMRKNAATDLFDAVPAGPVTDDTIWLQSTATATLTLWFF